MTPLEISTAAMSANSGLLIIVCTVASAAVLLFSFLHDKFRAFKLRHGFVSCSEDLVKPVSWNCGHDGIDANGVPFYGADDEIEMVVETDDLMPVGYAVKKDNGYGNSGAHAA